MSDAVQSIPSGNGLLLNDGPYGSWRASSYCLLAARFIVYRFLAAGQEWTLSQRWTGPDCGRCPKGRKRGISSGMADLLDFRVVCDPGMDRNLRLQPLESLNEL